MTATGRERSLLNLTYRWKSGDPHPRHKPKPFWDREWLEREFVHKGRSGTNIAAEFGVNCQTIYVWLKKFGIPVPDSRRPRLTGITKMCGGCSKILPLSEFRRRHKRRPDGSVVTYGNAWCRPCESAAKGAYTRAHRAEASVKEKERYRRRVAEMSPEEYREKILLPRYQYQRIQAAKDPGKMRALRMRRRCQKARGPGVASIDMRRALEGQKHRCWWCQKKLKAVWHVDHRIPLSKGGEHGPANIVISCPTCNVRKNAMMPWEFAGRLL